MNDQSLLAAWGVTTTAGWVLTHLLGASQASLLGTIVLAWTLLMAWPIGLTLARLARRASDRHGAAWAGLVALGMAENAFVVVAGGGDHSHGGGGHGSSEGGAPHEDRQSRDGGGKDEANAGSHTHREDHAHAGADQAGDSEHLHPDDTSAGHVHSADQTSSQTRSGQHDSDSLGHSDANGSHGHEPSGGREAGGDALVSADAQHVSFRQVWFAVAAVGFAYSAFKAEGTSRKLLYGAASALNALMVVLLFTYPPIEAAAFLIAAAIQGLPMLIDLPLYRAVRAAS
jgi:hypothetical protein